MINNHTDDSRRSPTKLVGALVSGLSILRFLSAQGVPMGVTKIARELKINPSTCFNLLRTLVHEGLLQFDESSKAYSVDLGLIDRIGGGLAAGTRALAEGLRKFENGYIRSYGLLMLLGLAAIMTWLFLQ